MPDTSAIARKAIYDKLVGTSSVTNLVGGATPRIYQGVAIQNTAYPYIVIGERATDQRFKTKDATIQSHRVRIYMYSRKGHSTFVEVEAIKAAVFNALEKQTLTVSPTNFIDCIQEGLDDSIIMPDGLTQRAIVEFAVTLQ